jgi:hypothetical protein
MLGRDAHTPEPVVPVPVLGVVVVPVRGAQVLGRIVERPAAQHPPPGVSHLSLPILPCAAAVGQGVLGRGALYAARPGIRSLCLGRPLQTLLPSAKLAANVIGLAQRVLALAVIEQLGFHCQP